MTDNIVQFDPDRFASRRMKPMDNVDKLIATYGADAIMAAMANMPTAGKTAARTVHPEHRRILEQNETLRAMRPGLVEFGKGMRGGADRMEKLIADVGELRKLCGGSGESLAKMQEARDGMAEAADTSQEIVASIDRILHAPVPMWMMERRA